ncbi:TerB family tellurite resistance protein [Bradyrhizobium niftali]|uniref:TerB family tellurite resistance protein n=1 Tax=Bradyrhizobium niftali TaxID=2560055 RepID=A0A4Y9LBZ9_9BRAD|nr:TerB family tellurite resistance protein [Bradyrhizobium niftali]TFV41130.1 TerB family tellurite resistance protein [Bradyrhizobium niftali]
MSMEKPNLPGGPLSGLVASAVEYMVDASQRSVLFLDIMRQRGDQYREHVAQTAPHVLQYAAELIMDGRQLDEPVNYALVRIIPPKDVEIDLKRRPFVVIDPRAGHGPGIGGFKADSEIGVAMKAGHPCYFIGFLPEPMPGQTIERIARAEAIFIEKVISRHPDADGKPCVIGNCQAGWAVMILASLRPELFGPLIIAGAPLAYWAGVHGKYPMRYSGGLLGGSWLTAMTSDLGAGKFDGAWLVQNFENQNPSNTLWTKQYNVYSKVDTEANRYLEFERWWGGHVNLNAEEIQFIVDELFIGNNLAAGKIEMSDGQKVDLRNIRSPIVVFCSEGDNVTPPQQALDWILDCYADVDEIRAYGQTIVYTVHESVGHLGIFVSGGVAKKEHAEFSSNIDLIDVLPPGLYEATFEAKGEETTSSDLVVGQWVMRCEARTLDDIRAMGGNSPEDERRFAAAKRVSELNLASYQKFAQPWIKKLVTPQMAETMRHLHPLRLQYEALSSQNPWMTAVKSAADAIEDNRKPVAKDNPFLAFQEQVSKQIVHALDSWRDAQEALSETIFLNLYGSPAVQAALGIDPKSELSRRREMSAEHRAMLDKRVAQLKSGIGEGGLREAAIRSLLYIGSARGMVDERSIEALRQIRRDYSGQRMTLPEFKMLVREQFFMLLIDREGALAAVQKLLPEDVNQRRAAFAAIREVLSASGEITGERASRLRRVAALFGVDTGEGESNVAPFDPKAKAS